MKKKAGVIAIIMLIFCLSVTSSCGFGSSNVFYKMLMPDGVLEEVDAVIAEIDAIGELTKDSEDAIALAREHYEALSDEMKKLVSNVDVLQKAEEDFAKSFVTPKSLSAKIASIEVATKENEAEIEGAYLDYWMLNEEEKAEVVGYERLCALREDVVKLYTEERRGDGRMARYKVQIGTYGVSVTDESDVRELVDCGIDFVASDYPDEQTMAWYNEYGIGTLVEAANFGIPCYYGGHRKDTDENQPSPWFSDETFRDSLQDALETIDSNPCVWGLSIVDEPNANDFEYYNNFAQIIYEEAPGIECYINLYPNYADYEQLGVKTYEAHVYKYVETVDTDYICYDHYFYGGGYGEEIERHLENCEIVARNCKESGRDFWIVIQANSDPNSKEGCIPLSQTKLKIQAFSAMAYGASVINWAGWLDGRCWWNNNIIQSNGEKSEQYDKVKNVNALIDELSPIYMKYEWVTTSTKGLPKSGQDVLSRMRVGTDTYFISGFFDKKGGEGGKALMLVNASNLMDESADGESSARVRFTLETPGENVVAYSYGKPERIYPDANGEYTVRINNGDCMFITID